MKKRFLATIVLFAANTGFADTNNQISEQVQSQSVVSTINATQQAELQKNAAQWGLSTEEYQLYEEIMKGPRGIQSPGLDPLTTLGIEAKTDQERRKFADIWVQQEFARVEKELAFQREINLAWSRNYPGTLPIAGTDLNLINDTNGRLALFVKADDCDRCDARLKTVLDSNRLVDIYLVGSNGDDEKIRQWAKEHAIPVDKVMNQQITLNHDKGEWITYGQAKMPVVLQQGAEGWSIAAF